MCVKEIHESSIFYKISTLDTLLAQFLLLVIVGARDVCNGYNVHPYVSTCQKVFKELEQALIEDETNLYSLKRMFFYAPSADPVNYSISFGHNNNYLA